MFLVDSYWSGSGFLMCFVWILDLLDSRWNGLIELFDGFMIAKFKIQQENIFNLPKEKEFNHILYKYIYIST